MACKGSGVRIPSAPPRTRLRGARLTCPPFPHRETLCTDLSPTAPILGGQLARWDLPRLAAPCLRCGPQVPGFVRRSECEVMRLRGRYLQSRGATEGARA